MISALQKVEPILFANSSLAWTTTEKDYAAKLRYAAARKQTDPNKHIYEDVLVPAAK